MVVDDDHVAPRVQRTQAGIELPGTIANRNNERDTWRPGDGMRQGVGEAGIGQAPSEVGASGRGRRSGTQFVEGIDALATQPKESSRGAAEEEVRCELFDRGPE
jgi:hypothetical protein